jgi:hypothetical protein
VVSGGQHRKGREEIMTAIKAAKAASRERISSQNGQPELVPYVYRQQQRRNTYAARIARRNAQEWGRPADLATSADDAFPMAVLPWGRAEILAASRFSERNDAPKIR